MIGFDDYLKPADDDVWAEAMLSESILPPPFYPSDFEDAACDALKRIGLSREHITPSNCKNVYKQLIQMLDS